MGNSWSVAVAEPGPEKPSHAQKQNDRCCIPGQWVSEQIDDVNGMLPYWLMFNVLVGLQDTGAHFLDIVGIQALSAGRQPGRDQLLQVFRGCVIIMTDDRGKLVNDCVVRLLKENTLP